MEHIVSNRDIGQRTSTKQVLAMERTNLRAELTTLEARTRWVEQRLVQIEREESQSGRFEITDWETRASV